MQYIPNESKHTLVDFRGERRTKEDMEEIHQTNRIVYSVEVCTDRKQENQNKWKGIMSCIRTSQLQ